MTDHRLRIEHGAIANPDYTLAAVRDSRPRTTIPTGDVHRAPERTCHTRIYTSH